MQAFLVDCIGLTDYIIRKIPIIVPKKQRVQPGDPFEDTVLRPGFEIAKL
jgi:hypothetical protein